MRGYFHSIFDVAPTRFNRSYECGRISHAKKSRRSMPISANYSRSFFSRAEKKIPGGVNSPVRAWRAVGGSPIFIARGAGSAVFDADQNRFIDYVGSYGT